MGALVLASLAIVRPADAAVFTVVHTGDSGVGSLRQALLDANASPGADSIAFDPALFGPITLLSPLPALSTDISLAGPASQAVALDGASTFRVLDISAGATVTISDLTIQNGADPTSSGAGAIQNAGSLTISRCVRPWSAPRPSRPASGAGGPVPLTIVDSELRLNQGAFGPGALAVLEGLATVRGSTFAANTGGIGGAITSGAALEMTTSTLSGNTALAVGGALFLGQGTATLSSCTVVGNSAPNAGDGGGVFVEAGTLTFKDSIVAGSLSGDDCAGPVVAVGTNFSTDATCAGFVTTAQLNLGPLASNPPGITPTHALLAGSVAIDAATGCLDANGGPLPTDQRGAPRPADGDANGSAVCDVGA